MGVTLPRWVWVGAGLLACVAGMVNVVGYLGFEHQAVTHLTGTTTLLGEAVARRDLRAISHLGGVALAFMAGAAISGMIVQDSTLRLGRRYGVALVLESVLLFAAIPLFKQGHLAGALLAAMACGLQNAMATTYSGAVIRTSHLSGMFTDLGIGLGQSLAFYAGHVRRAPRWMSRLGLEWAYRLSQEPGRLWRRYLVEDPQALPVFLGMTLDRLRGRPLARTCRLDTSPLER